MNRESGNRPTHIPSIVCQQKCKAISWIQKSFPVTTGYPYAKKWTSEWTT